MARRLSRRMGVQGGDGADVAARINIVAASMEDELRDRDLPPAPVAGWRYVDGTWLRWSELEGEYRPAPIPYSLVTYARTIGTPREGLAVAMIEGEWREVPSGAAPLRGHLGEQTEAATPEAGVGAPPPTSPAAPPVQAQPAPPDPAQERAHAESRMKDQLAAWRRRNRS